MVDCQLCGQALNNENVLECAFYQNIVNTYFHDISLRAVAAIYHRTAAALTHPPALPPLAIKQSFLPAARNTNKPVIQITLFTSTRPLNKTSFTDSHICFWLVKGRLSDSVGK